MQTDEVNLVALLKMQMQMLWNVNFILVAKAVSGSLLRKVVNVLRISEVVATATNHYT